MIRKLIVANRGEVASRVIRTARRLGIWTIAVHSEADVRALHVTEADEGVPIGPAAARDSYLKIEHILSAAERTGADAIHPGYGFLSESAEFARRCREAGLLFVGPPTDAIEAMGSKVAARRTAEAAGVPLIPGTGPLASFSEAEAAATDLGYPVVLKASAGGGGIGMQRVNNAKQLGKHFDAARDKSERYFGNSTVYLEKWLEQPRHVEVQIAADAGGRAIHLGERDCSVQRRNQKVIEETPSPIIDAALRAEMTEAATGLAQQVGYSSLGTVEMLVSKGRFYFLEMNTRLQVEHTVTEMVTGLDLVEWQLRLAMDEDLPAQRSDVQFNGHSIQCRIYAEQPDKGFLPSPGQITRFEVPQGEWIRNDVGVRDGDYVSPYYDPLIAKLVVHGPDRPAALERMRAALEDYRVEGVTTNLPLLRQVLGDEAFASGVYDTGFLRERLGYKA